MIPVTKNIKIRNRCFASASSFISVHIFIQILYIDRKKYMKNRGENVCGEIKIREISDYY